jgi:hypothetical protein
MTRRNQLLATIGALWLATAGAVTVWLVLTRDTRGIWTDYANDDRGPIRVGEIRVFDWPVFYLWLAVITVAAAIAAVLALIWTEAKA